MTHHNLGRTIFSAAAIVAGGRIATADAASIEACVVNENNKLQASDGDEIDGFGFSISVSGGIAIVGAWSDEDVGVLAGSAYMLRFNGDAWMEEQKLLASDANDWARFGHAVAVDGDLALIGSVNDDDACPGVEFCDSGSAYVFRFDGARWVEEQKLLPADSFPADQFGVAVALEGNLAVIGKVGDDEICDGDPSCNAGAAYVFRYNPATMSWEQEQKLLASDGDVLDVFGNAVAISGDDILVGARWDDDLGSNSGAVYVFRHRDTVWQEHQKLTASDGHLGADFGHAVRASGDLMVIGAPRDDDACPGDPLCLSGTAYVFQREGEFWVEQQKLVGSDTAAGDEFGWSVDVDGDNIVVGARWDDEACPEDAGCNSGSAYVFRFNGLLWEQERKLLASDTEATDFFGIDVAISGNTTLVGSYLDDDAGSASGSVYVFDKIDCNGNGVSDTCDIAGEQSEDANGNGVPDECELPGDANLDGVVDVLDLLAVVLAWGPCPPPPCPEDLDGDGLVGVPDLLLVILNWG
jgi:hypothetical protein